MGYQLVQECAVLGYRRSHRVVNTMTAPRPSMADNVIVNYKASCGTCRSNNWHTAQYQAGAATTSTGAIVAVKSADNTFSFSAAVGLGRLQGRLRVAFNFFKRRKDARRVPICVVGIVAFNFFKGKHRKELAAHQIESFRKVRYVGR